MNTIYQETSDCIMFWGCKYVFQEIYAKNIRISCYGICRGSFHSVYPAPDCHCRHRRSSSRRALLVFLLYIILFWSDENENSCTYGAEIYAKNIAWNFQNIRNGRRTHQSVSRFSCNNAKNRVARKSAQMPSPKHPC